MGIQFGKFFAITKEFLGDLFQDCMLRIECHLPPA